MKHDRSNSLNLEEEIEENIKNSVDQVRFGDALLKLLESTLEPQDGAVNLSDRKTQSIIAAIAFITKIYISESSRICPESLYQVVCNLHNIILTISDHSETLQDDISLLCEMWFKQDRDGKEAISPQMISYLLALALSNFNAKDAGRVITCQDALSEIDLDDPSAESVRILVQRCFLHSHFLMKEKGRKFLVHLFSLTPNLIDSLHMTIKSALVACDKEHAEIFAEIYFRAWKSLDGLFQMKLENCIQNFIHLSIYSANPVLLKNSKIVLKQFIDNKSTNRDIEEMLERLYSPILWKSFEVANPQVRENALFQFALVFPLLPTDMRQREVDTALQDQIGLLVDCLSDKFPNVRKQAVLASGRILSLYWELLPHQIISTILDSLFNHLAFDSSSFSVRESVLKAIVSIMQNYLSHSTIEAYVRKIVALINDNNEKVRGHMVKLLETISKKTNFEFYRFVSVDDLLKTLGGETNKKNQHALTRLLMPTYWPEDIEKVTKERIKRCANAVLTDANSAVMFYTSLDLRKASLTEVVQFIRGLWKRIIQKWIVERPDSSKGNKKQKTVESFDKETIISILRIIVVVWDKIDEKLASSDNTDLIQKLVYVFTDDLMVSLTEKVDHISIYRIAAHLPASLIPKFVEKCTQALSTTKFQTQYFECLFTWKDSYGDTILEDINGGLTASLQENEDDFSQEISNHLNMLLSLLNGDEWLRSEVLSSDKIEETLSILKKYFKFAENKLKGSSDSIEDGLIVLCLQTYFRILFHMKAINAENQIDYNISTELESLLEWLSSNVVSILKTDLEDEELNLRILRDEISRKHRFPIELLKAMLTIMSDYYTLGYAGNSFGSRVLFLIASLLQCHMTLDLFKLLASSTWRILLNYWFRYPSTDIFDESNFVLKDESFVLSLLAKVIQKDRDVNGSMTSRIGLKTFKTQIRRRNLMQSLENIQRYINGVELGNAEKE